MGSVIDFGQRVQEILQNNYFTTKFENSKIRAFVPVFWNFMKMKIFLKKYPVFWTLNTHISRTANATVLNEAILKSSHEGLSFDGIESF